MILRRLRWPAALSALALACLPSTTASAAPRPVPGARTLQQGADALHAAGVTGVAVRLDTPRGTVTARAGVADPVTRRPVPADGFLRLGSTTKTFVATVLLQLVGERRVGLGQSVEDLLPGVVTGAGNDGRTITVRDLLGHTSGLPDYVGDVFPEPTARTYFAHRWQAYAPAELVALALRHEPAFPAGTGWAYSNTNYVLAGMIIEKVTGDTWERQVHERVLRPLGLRDTDTPGTRPFLPRPHARDHQQFTAGGPMVDTTIPYRPFDSGADGSMTGTARDLNRFLGALAAGRLLKPAEQAALLTMVPVGGDSGHPEGTEDGLGLFRTPLSCGGGHLGHGGNGFGYVVRAATTPDGRRSVTVSAHSRSADPRAEARQERALRELVDRALCDGA
ncbi:serine hydrolase domain-containing protein [Streptomyces sp. AD55]|uniref:serine hydrolase domain-containing protein n=1 Tax=Streptomyces sp. AD55 TaxID=3242895 RepID=UPI0035285291